MKFCSILLLLGLVGGNLAAAGGNQSAKSAGSSGVTGFEKNIMLIVPYTPGAAADSYAQMVKKIGEKYISQRIDLEYKPGGNTNVGTNYMLARPHDGYTVSFAGNNPEFMVATEQVEGMYDENSYVSIGSLASEQSVLVAPKNSPFNNFTELVTYAKANPGKIRWGAAGSLTYNHFLVLKVSKAAGITVNYIPYDNAGEVSTAVLGGNIDIGTITGAMASSYKKSGDMKFLAQGYKDRDPTFSDVPTIYETPGCEFEKFGAPFIIERSMIAPAGSPASVLKAWDNLLLKITQDPDFIAWLQPQGVKPDYMSGEDHTKIMRAATQSVRELYKTMK